MPVKEIIVITDPFFRGKDYFYLLLQELNDKYGFVAGGSSTNLYETDFLPNTVWFFVEDIENGYVEKWNSSTNVDKDVYIDFQSKYNVFYSFVPSTNINKLLKGIRFYNKNGDFIGVYNPEMHILIGTHWVYNEHCVSDAKSLLTKISQYFKPKEKNKVVPFFKRFEVEIDTEPELELLRDWNGYVPIRKILFSVDDYYSYEDIDELLSEGNIDLLTDLCPMPSKDPVQHVENIREIIRQLTELRKPVSTRGDVFSLDFHIHFIVPIDVKRFDYIKKMVEPLDDFLGKVFINLSGKARKNKILSSYDWSDFNWFEYRTLPSAVMHNPKILEIVLKIAKSIIEEFVKNGKITYEVDENGIATKESYLEITKISEDEYNYMFDFVNRYDEVKKNESIINKLYL